MKAEIINGHWWIEEINPAEIKNTYNTLLKKCGFTILNFQEHYFTPYGWSGLYLLAESHFAIHTFPEEVLSYIELSSCNREYYNNFILTMKTYDLHFNNDENSNRLGFKVTLE
jgi:S-adenosylmethionine decarboxylase